MKTDVFQSCGHRWVFQTCWHIECSTFTASSFRIWNITVIQIYAPTSNAEEAEVEWWRPTTPFRTNTQKRCPFHYRGLECKSRKSRNTWSNRQIWPWNVEWSRAKTNRVLTRKCTGYSKHPLPTTQEKTLHTDITRWSTLKSDWLYSLQPKTEKLYTVKQLSRAKKNFFN